MQFNLAGLRRVTIPYMEKRAREGGLAMCHVIPVSGGVAKKKFGERERCYSAMSTFPSGRELYPTKLGPKEFSIPRELTTGGCEFFSHFSNVLRVFAAVKI